MAKVVKQVFKAGLGTIRVIRLRYGDQIWLPMRTTQFKGEYTNYTNYVVGVNCSVIGNEIYLLNDTKNYYCNTVAQATDYIKQTYDVEV